MRSPSRIWLFSACGAAVVHVAALLVLVPSKNTAMDFRHAGNFVITSTEVTLHARAVGANAAASAASVQQTVAVTSPPVGTAVESTPVEALSAPARQVVETVMRHDVQPQMVRTGIVATATPKAPIPDPSAAGKVTVAERAPTIPVAEPVAATTKIVIAASALAGTVLPVEASNPEARKAEVAPASPAAKRVTAAAPKTAMATSANSNRTAATAAKAKVAVVAASPTTATTSVKPQTKKLQDTEKRTTDRKKKFRKKATKTSDRNSRASSRTSGSRKKGTKTKNAGSRGRKVSAVGKARMRNYLGRIVSRLQRQKRYPSAARKRKAQGTVVIAFVVNSNGRVSRARIRKSSGNQALDSEVRRMLKRAAPFPSFPESMGRKSLSLSVPISFRLR